MGNQFVYLHIHKGKFLFFWYRYIWNNEASVFSSLFFFAITEKIYSDRTEIMEAWQTSPWQDGYSQYGTIYMPSSGQGLISNTHSKYQQQINYINKQGKKNYYSLPELPTDITEVLHSGHYPWTAHVSLRLNTPTQQKDQPEEPAAGVYDGRERGVYEGVEGERDGLMLLL